MSDKETRETKTEAEKAEAAKEQAKAKAKADRAKVAEKVADAAKADAAKATAPKANDAGPEEAAAEAAPAPQQRKLTEPPKGNIVATAWLVLLLAMAFGSGLAGIEIWLKPKIEQNKLNEALSQIPNLVKGATKGKKDEKTIPGRRIFRAFDGSGKLVGWVVQGKGQGFADAVEVLIGLDRQAKTLTGIFVLDQKETPGLGNYIVDKPFTGQFRGLKVGAGGNKLRASQDPPQLAKGQIKAVTGATISSQTVCTIINKTVGEVQSKLATAAKGG